MLVACPECERKVSDKAAACPDCGFPVAQHFTQQAEAKRRDEARGTRKVVGEVDCVDCRARGFRMASVKCDDGVTRELFEWCVTCERSGRAVLCESTLGFYAVGFAQVDSFIAGTIDEGTLGVHALGTAKPEGHRYEKAGERIRDDKDE